MIYLYCSFLNVSLLGVIPFFIAFGFILFLFYMKRREANFKATEAEIQTKMAKVEPMFKTAVNYLMQTDLQPMCQVLDILGKVRWSVNDRVLESVEYVWSIGGGLGTIPNRYNAR